MKIIGIIAEYNPFHFGHLYQINKIKEIYPESIIILITNSTFTQRGDIAILPKKEKTKITLENNIDLVVELPFIYATQSADIFAKGAIEILNHLKIDTLVFGSESNNIQKILSIVNTQLYHKDYDKIVKKYLKQGLNYPTALNKSLIELTKESINEPNDLLGISYIKEIKKNNYKITPITIQRIGSYHDKKPTNKIANATMIREKIQKKENISKYIPDNEKKLLITNLSLNNYFPFLKYKILSEKDLSIYQTVEEGIENRIKTAINKSNSWTDLVKNIKTKRYTYNKINRMLIHILTSFTKEEAKNLKIDYIKILGFNQRGRKYLNMIKKDIKIPIIYHYKKNLSPTLDIELRTTKIYNLPLTNKIDEYNEKPIIINDETYELPHLNPEIKEVEQNIKKNTVQH